MSTLAVARRASSHEVLAKPLIQEGLQDLIRKVQGVIAKVSFPNEAILEDLPRYIHVLDDVTRGINFCSISEDENGVAEKVAELTKKLAGYEPSALFKKKEEVLDQSALEAFSNACSKVKNTIQNAYTHQQSRLEANRIPGNFQISELALQILSSIIKQEKWKKTSTIAFHERSIIELWEAPSLKVARKVVLHREENLANEAFVLSFLRHSRLVQMGLVENLAIQGNNFAFTLEYAPRRDLSSLLREEKLSKEFTMNVFLKGVKNIIEFLAFLHKDGFKHRDLKPENTLLMEDMTFKICDVEFIGKEERRLGMGTPDYAPKEVFKLDAKRDTSVDIWSLGIVLFKTLTGCDFYQTGSLSVQDAIELVYNSLFVTQEDFENKIKAKIDSCKKCHAERFLQLDQEGFIQKILVACLQIDPAKRPTAEKLLDLFAEKILSLSSLKEALPASASSSGFAST